MNGHPESEWSVDDDIDLALENMVSAMQKIRDAKNRGEIDLAFELINEVGKELAEFQPSEAAF